MLKQKAKKQTKNSADRIHYSDWPKAKVITDDWCSNMVERVITYCTPDSIMIDFKSTFTGRATNQTNSRAAVCCIITQYHTLSLLLLLLLLAVAVVVVVAGAAAAAASTTTTTFYYYFQLV